MRSMKYFFGLLVVVCGTMWGQTKKQDSLKLELSKATHDTTRCNILLLLMEAESNGLTWQPYIDQLKTISEKHLKTISASDPAYKVYSKYLANCYNNLGYLAEQNGNAADAQQHYIKSLKIFSEIDYKPGIATALHSLAFIYNNQGNISMALEFFSRSLKLFEEIGDKHGTATSLNTIGLIYYNQRDITKALEYYEKSLKIREAIGDKQGIASSLNNLGTIYRNQGDITRALDYHSKSLKLRKEMGDKLGTAVSLNNLGFTYNTQGETYKALDYYEQSLRLREEVGDKKGIASSLNNIGSIYIKLASAPDNSAQKTKYYNQAFNYTSRSLEMSRELGYPENIRNASKSLQAIYRAKGDYKNALKYYELYIEMRDSIRNEDTRKASIKNQLKYEYGKKIAADSVAYLKETEIRRVQMQQQQAEIKAKKNQQYALFGGLALVLVFAGLMYNRFRITQKQKQIIEKQKLEVEAKQKEILDSIHYAQRIQRTLITSEKYISRKLRELNNRK
jgi:tetratricopeptide (TPR) repeat protein